MQPTVSKVKEFNGKGKSRVAEICLEDIEDMAILFRLESSTILKAAITRLSDTASGW